MNEILLTIIEVALLLLMAAGATTIGLFIIFVIFAAISYIIYYTYQPALVIIAILILHCLYLLILDIASSDRFAATISTIKNGISHLRRGSIYLKGWMSRLAGALSSPFRASVPTVADDWYTFEVDGSQATWQYDLACALGLYRAPGIKGVYARRVFSLRLLPELAIDAFAIFCLGAAWLVVAAAWCLEWTVVIAVDLLLVFMAYARGDHVLPRGTPIPAPAPVFHHDDAPVLLDDE